METGSRIIYEACDKALSAREFIGIANAVWPGSYSAKKTQEALLKTINITARDQSGSLIGCVRLLSDGYYFTVITEILVLPHYWKQGIGTKLMELAFENSPSSLFFGAQPGNEVFFEKLGYEKSMQSYIKKKQRQP